MAALNVPVGGALEGFLAGDDNRILRVRPGPVAGFDVQWPELKGRKPVLSGEVFFGKGPQGEGRLYGRFTRVHTQDGISYPVCFELYDSGATEGQYGKRGVWLEPGSTPEDMKIWDGVKYKAVNRFK